MSPLNFHSSKSSNYSSRCLIAVCFGLLSLTVTGSRLESDEAGKDTESPVDFERHVAPMLGRLGCNAAACHGAFGGKGGFQLSLFGYSTRMDHENLSQRVDTDEPTESLMLLKPSGDEDHEGGIRFEKGSDVYQAIHRWIEQGAKWSKGSGQVRALNIQPSRLVFATTGSEPQPLRVTAEFSDGSSEDVTELCQFTSRDEGIAEVTADGSVRAVREGDTSVIVSYRDAFAAVAALVPFPGTPPEPTLVETTDRIDREILEKLQSLNIRTSPRSSDSEFLRRLTLDTIGSLPTPDDVRTFCEDADPDKREKKINELLAHPMHAALWATRMCDMTKCDVTTMGDDEELRDRRAQMWHEWFRIRFAENRPYNEIVRGVIVATSRENLAVADWIQKEASLIRQDGESGPSGYAQRESLDIYWRRVTPEGQFPLKEISELTAAAFTGVRLNCAQCHKHPFDRWTQDDYAAFTNIFASVVYGNSPELNKAIFAELESRRQRKRQGETVEPLPKLREVFVSDLIGRDIPGSEKGVRVSPRAFESKPFAGHVDSRQQFYEWLVHPDNAYFSRNFANRVWATYFGVGIVEPVDDFSISNPPSHPGLLKELARFFVESDFDIRKLEKRILMSQGYQRTSAPNETNLLDQRNFARQYVRPLMAEVALDCINQTLGVGEDFGGNNPRRAIEVGTNVIGGEVGRALEIFGRGRRQSICDCDRRKENDLRQYIYLINDPSIFEKIKKGSLRECLTLENGALVEKLYLRFFGREPGKDELEIAETHLERSDNRELAFNDLVWALLNSREFLTNH